MLEKMSKFDNEKSPVKLFLVISIAVFIGFGLFHMNKFITADEHYWIYERIPQYWRALEDRNIKDTLINDKPGVSLAIVSGLSLLGDKNPETAISKVDDNFTAYDTERIDKQLWLFRLPILFVNSALVLLFFWLIKKITSNEWVALWTVISICFSPILLGISQIINPDSLLWSFFFAAILSFCALLKFQEKKYLFLTILFTGLSLATKYVANILFPFYLLLFILSLLFDSNENPENTKNKTLKQLANYYFIAIGSTLLLIIFIPAISVKPVYLYRLTVGFSEMRKIAISIIMISGIVVVDTFILKNKILIFIKGLYFRSQRVLKLIPFSLVSIFGILILGRIFNKNWQLFERVAFDIKDLSNIEHIKFSVNYLEKILLEFNPLVFSLSPIILLLLFILWIKWIKSADRNYFFYILSFSLFIFIFFIASIESNTLSTVRYSIVLYPIVFLLSAFSLNSILRTNRERIGITIILAFFLFGSLWVTKPFYFNYTNILLPKDKIISDAWGYGGYEAAQYLNTQENAENKIIWSDYYGVCEFFKGKCITDYQFDENQYPIDYFVLTRRGEIRYNPADPRRQTGGYVAAYKYYPRDNPEWQLFIGGRDKNYTKVFKADENPERNTLKIGLITDIHKCEAVIPNGVSKEKIGRFITSANVNKTAFNVNLGDSASYRVNKCSLSAKDDFIWIYYNLKTISPVYKVLSDHDVDDKETYYFWLEKTGYEKTYYAFSYKDARILVLDTITGGGIVLDVCEKEPVCSEYKRKFEELSEILDSEEKLKIYLEENNISKDQLVGERRKYKKLYEEEDLRCKHAHSIELWDKGQVLDEQLRWIQNELETTDKDKVVLFSDHPLFRFQSERKLYDIANRQALADILKNSGKKIISISGESHVWYEVNMDGIQYYVIDDFSGSEGGNWAIFKWKDDDYELTKYINGEAENI
jgi:hypothetical protein